MKKLHLHHPPAGTAESCYNMNLISAVTSAHQATTDVKGTTRRHRQLQQ